MFGKKTLAAAAATIVLGGGSLGLAQVANAQTPTPTPTPGATSTTSTTTPTTTDSPGDRHGPGDRGPGGHGHEGRGGHGGGMAGPDLAKTLATKLGVTEDKVTTALDSLRDSLRPQEPTSTSTRPTAAERQAQHDAMEAKLVSGLASKLGISEAKVKAAVDAIQSEREATMQTEFKTYLDEQVKAGTITQADADVLLKAAKAHVIDYGRGAHR